MADEVQSIRSLNWRELFPFTNLFRAFRIAIHPSKLVLGFALLFLVYVGGRVLDALWPASQYASYHEIDSYEQFRWSHAPGTFDDERIADRNRKAEKYAMGLVGADIVKDRAVAKEDALLGRHHADIQRRIVSERNKELENAVKAREDERKAVGGKSFPSEIERHNAEHEVDLKYDARVRMAQTDMQRAIDELDEYTPQAIFDLFFSYEVRQFHGIVDNAVAGNFLNGVFSANTHGQGAPADRAEGTRASSGVILSISNLVIVGPNWLLRYHPVYFVLFAVWFLILWAIFGGAIARIAAVHVARDEKISVRQALRFSFSKLLSFVFAPLIPLMIILVAGVLIAAGGLLMYIPVVGPILVGALFILALLAGFVMTLVAAGTVGGFNLMYSTIAVEGSDSFDAISRSFSYVFARPWRMLFYTAISLIYGAICFIFVRYFVYVMLGLTHYFAQWFLGGRPAQFWPEIWPVITDQDLTYRVNRQALAWSEYTAAVLIEMWVYVVLSFLAAFVISFYFSANTIIYYLMRKEVDATELDDVYVEETEDEFGEPAAATPAAASAVPVASTGIASSTVVPTSTSPANVPTPGTSPAPDAGSGALPI